MRAVKLLAIVLCLGYLTNCTVARLAAVAALSAGGYAALTAEDKAAHDATLVSALQSNHEQSWKNEKNGTSGSFTPLKTVQVDGQNCQQMREVIRIKQDVSEATFAACRGSDGSIERKKA
tara:strand:- start:29 stop:388 length:360 start_codon:yes stop_codon:yes gene_type:complete